MKIILLLSIYLSKWKDVHGLKILTPVGLKSLTFLVTTVIPWTITVVAIMASQSERG